MAVRVMLIITGVLVLVALATIARADHHEFDVCEYGHVGNCAGPGDVQNKTIHLGRFAPGAVFHVGLYFKDQSLKSDRCEVSWWIGSEFGLSLAPNTPSLVFNYANMPDMIAATTQQCEGCGSPPIIQYQYPSTPSSTFPFVQPPGTFDEIPDGFWEWKIRVVHIGSETTTGFPEDMGDPNNPFGWTPFQVSAGMPESRDVHMLGLTRAWELRIDPAGSGQCECNPVFPFDCTGAFVDWLEPKQDANQFSYIVDCYSADFDGSGSVGGPDFTRFAAAFGTVDGDAAYDWEVDSNGDGVIGGPDWTAFSEQWLIGPVVCP